MISKLAATHYLSPSTVTISVPASVAGDLKKINHVTKDILGRLGCLGCHSGFDLRFVIERDYRVNPNLEIQEFNARAGF